MAESRERGRSIDLRDFFSAAEARTDRWRQMSAVGRAWESSVMRGKPDEASRDEAAKLLGEVAILEDYWAYPGTRLMTTVRDALKEGNAAVFARVVQKISNALLTGSYRHETGAWDPLEEGEGRVADVLLPEVQQGNGQKPYFEALVVTPNDPRGWERARNDLRRLRRPEDSFVFEIVQVGSFEDGCLGAIFNMNVQAVVLYDGFEFRSRHDLPVMRDFLVRHLRIDPNSVAPGALATTLARSIKGFRPELDIYL